MLSAISGIEQALWDILGKEIGLPVYQLLGGPVRDSIRLYRSIGGNTPDVWARNARDLVRDGYNALKVAPFGATKIVDAPSVVDRAVEIIKSIRAAVGEDIEIAVDCHGRLSPSMARIVAKALEPYSPMFLEEPCLPENVDVLACIARSTSIPIATGERLVTRWGFREILEKQAAAIIQPDLSHAGGILECRKIAAMAEVYYVGVAPHNPLGPIALASCLQLDACTPNFLIQEQGCLGEGYLKQPFRVQNGCLRLSKDPGLGIELDEDALEDKIYTGDWENPRLTHEDGSVADW